MLVRKFKGFLEAMCETYKENDEEVAIDLSGSDRMDC